MLHAISKKEIVAIGVGLALVALGYTISNAITNPPIAAAASCELGATENSAIESDEIYVVGCSGIY